MNALYLAKLAGKDAAYYKVMKEIAQLSSNVRNLKDAKKLRALARKHTPAITEYWGTRGAQLALSGRQAPLTAWGTAMEKAPNVQERLAMRLEELLKGREMKKTSQIDAITWVAFQEELKKIALAVGQAGPPAQVKFNIPVPRPPKAGPLWGAVKVRTGVKGKKKTSAVGKTLERPRRQADSSRMMDAFVKTHWKNVRKTEKSRKAAGVLQRKFKPAGYVDYVKKRSMPLRPITPSPPLRWTKAK